MYSSWYASSKTNRKLNMSVEQLFKKLALRGVDAKETTLGQKTGLYGSEKQYST